MTKPNRLDDYGELLTVPELAEVLRTGRNTAYEIVKRGLVESVRIGKLVRVPRAAVLKFIQSAEKARFN